MNRIKRIVHPLTRPFRWFRKTRRRNKFLTIIALLILAFIIGDQIQKATATPPYVTTKVKQGNIVEIVSETGNVNTAGRVDVTSTATGIIEELYVQNNDTVEIDEPLFKVRSTATNQEKATAYATYQKAVSAQKTAEQTKQSLDAAMWTAHKLLLDKREVKRVKDDHKSDYENLEQQSIDAAAVQTEKDFAAAERKYKEADIAVSAARADVAAASIAYQATKNAVVTAPSSGTIANLSLAVGDKVTAGGGSLTSGAGTATLDTSAALGAAGTSQPVLTIANLSDNYSIKIALNEVDIPKVTLGQKATIKLDAFTRKSFRGIVTHVDTVGTNNQGVVTYNVLVAIENPYLYIKPGMTANVDIEVDRVTNVLMVPNSAVKPYKGGRSVRIIDPKTKEMKNIPVQIGLKGTNNTQIIKGVTEGQEVITALSNDQVKRPGPFQ